MIRLPLLCRLGFHRWSIWSEAFPVHVEGGFLIMQQRHCLRCKRVQESSV